MRKEHLIVPFLLAALFSCKPNMKVSGDKGALEGLNNNWELESIHGIPAKRENHKTPALQFLVDMKKVNGNTGCNGMGGNIETSGDSLRFVNIISTKMFCEGSLEPEFVKALDSINRYHIDGNKLHLMNGTNTLLVFKKLD